MNVKLQTCAVFTALTIVGAIRAELVRPDFSAYSSACGVAARAAAHGIEMSWRIAPKQYGALTIDTRPDHPLIEEMGISDAEYAKPRRLLQGVEPLATLTVGMRQAPSGRPPEMSIWNTFFDKPASRPYQTHGAKRDLKSLRVESAGRRARIVMKEITIGQFRGELVIIIYADCPLVHVEHVVATSEDHRAILYDAGLTGSQAGWERLAWYDTQGRLQRAAIDADAADRPLAVRYRTLAVENSNGTVVCFPPPHQFHFPRDWTDNLQFSWSGRHHQQLPLSFGLGIRQAPDGRRAFEPWFNAPPQTHQRLGVFYLLSSSQAEDALREALRFTHSDRFPALPGHITLTSHWHMAVAVTAMAQKKQAVPSFVGLFKDMGVNVVHLGEFHGDGHPRDPGPLRLPEMEMMFRECSRLSDADLLLLPGEEGNDFLGIRAKGRQPGHWMCLFPRPVYWTMQRGPSQPFTESDARYGKIYHVGSRDDMIELLKRENGLAWTAHPRIKASSWTPDVFRDEEFYKADYWLGAAWKALPADLSRPRLGERALNLLDDMANWGGKKYLLGEVDVFKIDPTHELYGHMNINYVRLDCLPRYEMGWQSILDAIRTGRFFVSTGEILLHDFTVGGKRSGETLPIGNPGPIEVKLELEWTFPLQFAELVSGDGHKSYRERIDLRDTIAFGKRTLKLQPDLRGRKWVRVEVWDVAVNGAFSQPVWLAAH